MESDVLKLFHKIIENKAINHTSGIFYVVWNFYLLENCFYFESVSSKKDK